MRPLLRKAAAIDSLFLGASRQNRTSHSLCRQCQEKLRTSSRSIHFPGRRAAFTTYTRRQNEAVETSKRASANVYEPAENWDGLEWIGSQEWIDARDALPVAHEIFLPQNKLTEPQDISRALHRAFVEVYALAASGRRTPKALWPKIAQDDPDKTQTVRLKPDAETKSGKALLVFADHESRKRLCESLGIELPASSWTIDKVRGMPQEAKWDILALGSEAEKFTIVKRIMQLTGIRISDHLVNTCQTAGSLFSALTAKTKDIKVAQALAEDERLEDVNNVSIRGRRLLDIDKDHQLGRLKIIQRELEERGLATMPQGMN